MAVKHEGGRVDQKKVVNEGTIGGLVQFIAREIIKV